MYTETHYSNLEATLRRILRTREVDKVLTDLWIASWKSLMRGVPVTDVVLTDPGPTEEGDAIHVHCVQTEYKPNYRVTTIWGRVKSLMLPPIM